MQQRVDGQQDWLLTEATTNCTAGRQFPVIRLLSEGARGGDEAGAGQSGQSVCRRPGRCLIFPSFSHTVPLVILPKE